MVNYKYQVYIILLSLISSLLSITNAETTSLSFATPSETCYLERDYRNQVVKSPININYDNDLVLREEGRIFFNFIGDFIMGISWLPIEINVPDLLGAMFESLQSAWNFMTLNWLFGSDGSDTTQVPPTAETTAEVAEEVQLVAVRRRDKKVKKKRKKIITGN